MSLALKSVVEGSGAEASSAEERAAAMGRLGFLLSAATDPGEATRAVVETSLKFFDWDASFLHLYDPATDTVSELTNIDTIDGRRVDIRTVLEDHRPSPLLRKVMKEGPELILRHAENEGPVTVRFGDTTRVSMSLMFVPVRIEHRTIGVLSVQSYRRDAYNHQDLEILQGLADHVAGALARLQAETALKELSQQLFYHVDNSPLAVIEWGPDLRIRRWSGGAERVFGWTAEEVLGKNMEEFHWVHEDDMPKVVNVGIGLRTGTTPRGFSANRNYRKDGAVIHCEWYNSALIDEAGKVTSILSQVLDVSERKEAEAALQNAQEKLRRHAQELEETVARRTSSLQETVAELEQFSYALTHDMRAPLRAMMSFAQLLEAECGISGNPVVSDYGARIRQAASRMDQLIQDSLDYSQAVRAQLPGRPVDLHRLILELIDSYPILKHEKNKITIQDRLPWVLGNEAALTQCFSNLLGNAVKFVVRGQEPHVRVRGETRQDRVRIWIEDEGIGVPVAAQQRIFDMFQRATRDYEGTGIGLAIVRKVVQRMGGSVGVESEEGKGSRFWVELPAGPAHQLREAKAAT
jgi:PAS domain S-box-containing protein